MKAIFSSEDWGFPSRQQFEEDRVAFDLEPFVLKATRQINMAVEAHVVEILREAYHAGYSVGAMECSNSALGFPVTPASDHFEDWLEIKRQEIRCQAL